MSRLVKLCLLTVGIITVPGIFAAMAGAAMEVPSSRAEPLQQRHQPASPTPMLSADKNTK